jgi:hypothetical protein
MDGGDKGLGLVKENFLKYAEQPNAAYPANDISYISPLSRYKANRHQNESAS